MFSIITKLVLCSFIRYTERCASQHWRLVHVDLYEKLQTAFVLFFSVILWIFKGKDGDLVSNKMIIFSLKTVHMRIKWHFK